MGGGGLNSLALPCILFMQVYLNIVLLRNSIVIIDNTLQIIRSSLHIVYTYDTQTIQWYKWNKGASINHVDMEGGRGVSQMSMLLHKPYLVKWSTKGEGVTNIQKTVHMVYGCPHTSPSLALKARSRTISLDHNNLAARK